MAHITEKSFCFSNLYAFKAVHMVSKARVSISSVLFIYLPLQVIHFSESTAVQVFDTDIEWKKVLHLAQFIFVALVRYIRMEFGKNLDHHDFFCLQYYVYLLKVYNLPLFLSVFQPILQYFYHQIYHVHNSADCIGGDSISR